MQLCLIAPALYVPGILIGFRWYFLGLALSVVVAFCLWRVVRPMPTAFRQIGLALGGWLAVNYISALWAIDAPTVVLASVNLTILAALWFVGAVIGRFVAPLSLARFFSYCIVAVGTVFAYMLLTYGTVRPVTDEITRVFGAGSNIGAMHTVVALPLLLWRVHAKPSLPSVLTVLVAVMIVVSAQSRAAYLSMALVFMLWMVLHVSPRYSRSVRLILGIAMVAILAAIATAVSPATMLRLINVGRAVSDPTLLIGDGQSDLARLATYYFGWVAYQEHPWLGIGYRTLQLFMENQIGYGEASHNLIVTLMAETGIPGTLAFSILMLVFFNTVKNGVHTAASISEANWRVAVGIAMMSTLLNGMFHQVPEFQFFYLLLGLVSGWSVPDPKGTAVQRIAAPPMYAQPQPEPVEDAVDSPAPGSAGWSTPADASEGDHSSSTPSAQAVSTSISIKNAAVQRTACTQP